jgi:hypothetical protein
MVPAQVTPGDVPSGPDPGGVSRRAEAGYHCRSGGNALRHAGGSASAVEGSSPVPAHLAVQGASRRAPGADSGPAEGVGDLSVSCGPCSSAPRSLRTANAKKREGVTAANKKWLCELAVARPELTHQQVADIFEAEIGIRLERSTVTRAIKRKADYLEMPLANPNLKRVAASRFPLIDDAVFELIRCAALSPTLRASLTDQRITGFAKAAAAELGFPMFKASPLWLHRLRERRGIGPIRPKVDKLTKSEAECYNIWPKSDPAERASVISNFSSLDDIYNLDATTLMMSASPAHIDWAQPPVQQSDTLPIPQPARFSQCASGYGATPSGGVSTAAAALSSGAQEVPSIAYPVVGAVASPSRGASDNSHTGRLEEDSAGDASFAAAAIGSAGEAAVTVPSLFTSQQGLPLPLHPLSPTSSPSTSPSSQPPRVHPSEACAVLLCANGSGKHKFDPYVPRHTFPSFVFICVV